MRLLHTSDWHVGRTFHGSDTVGALTDALAALARIVRDQEVDVVLVAGDVYDSALPSGRHVEALTNALAAIREAGASIVLSSGNHDSPARLGANAGFARAGGLFLSTSAIDPESWRIELRDEHGPVQVFAIPYLEPLALRTAFPDADIRDQAAALRWAMDAVRAHRAQHPGRTVVLSHCFASTAAQPSADELAEAPRDITVGGLDVVPVDVFDGADYVALGHIHSRATLADHVRYSGAPLHYSFGERSPERGAWLVTLDETGLAGAEWVALPVPRPLTTLEGELEALLGDPAHDGTEQHWLRVRLTDRTRPVDAMRRLQQRWPNCAEVIWAGGTTAPESDVRERLARRSDAEVVGDFLEHVRAGVGASADEAALVQDALERVAAEERAR